MEILFHQDNIVRVAKLSKYSEEWGEIHYTKTPKLILGWLYFHGQPALPYIAWISVMSPM